VIATDERNPTVRRQQQDGWMLAEWVAPFVTHHECACSIQLGPTPRPFDAEHETTARGEQGQTLAVTVEECAAL
jgi:hypothetical protein